MSTSWHKVKLDGLFVGWLSYQNTADVWRSGVWDRPADDRDRGELVGKMHCECRDSPDVVKALVDVWGDDAEFRWCKTCRTIIHPPFDGYAYHEYDCPMESDCVCGAK